MSSHFSKFINGSPILVGDSTIPGVQIDPKLRELIPTIFKAVADFGCDYYETVVQMLTADEMSEIAAYGGFPVRYPHWKFGMEYETIHSQYLYGMSRIYELVINTKPCYIYCMDSNTLVDNITVIAHALGHSDFFKNNIFFGPTSQNMLNQLANHGTRIRKYMSRWGKETVTEFIDHVLSLDTLVDMSKVWEKRKIKNPIVKDDRQYEHPSRLKVSNDRGYMEPYINTEEWINKQKEAIERREMAAQLEVFTKPTKDILAFLRDNAPLKVWQADIVSMLYDEAVYFRPQGATKMLNEGWASYIDYQIMAVQGLSALGSDHPSCGIIDYASHKWGTLGGKYSMNPYKLGFCLFQDIEDRWNKGKFGPEWDQCTDAAERQKWDKKLNLGREKVFEVRKLYNDLTAIVEFFTPEFCEKYEFFEWKKYPNGEYKIESRDHQKIKEKLIRRYANLGLPEVVLADPNHRGKGVMLLQHNWDGQPLHGPYAKSVLESVCYLWKNEVVLTTKDADGGGIVYRCNTPGSVSLMTEEDYVSML